MSKTIRVILAEPYIDHPPRLSLRELKYVIQNSCVPVEVEIITLADQLYSIQNSDILIFSLSNPLEFTPFFNFLLSARLPIERKNRKPNMPLVIAGGMGLVNPESLGEFIDIMVLGSSLKPFQSLLQVLYKEGKTYIFSHLSESLSGIASLYIPSNTKALYARNGKIVSLANPYHVYDTSSSSLQTHSINLSENEAALILDIGCKHKCSFCLLGFWFHHRCTKLLDLYSEIDILADKGVTQIKIVSATATQNQSFLELLKYIHQKNMTVALGSIRIDEIDSDVLHELSEIHRLSSTQYLYRQRTRNGAPSLTFGIECGSDRLLSLINKSMTIKKIQEGIENATRNGVTNIGEYFLVGIPTEQISDLHGIADLIAYTCRCVTPYKGEVFININPLIPTPNTPMQRAEILSVTEYNEKVAIIKQYVLDELGPNIFENTLHIDTLSPDALLIETIAFRGDRRMGTILANIGNSITEPTVEQSLKSAKLPSLAFYRRRIPKDDIAPWQLVVSSSVQCEEMKYLKRVEAYE